MTRRPIAPKWSRMKECVLTAGTKESLQKAFADFSNDKEKRVCQVSFMPPTRVRMYKSRFFQKVFSVKVLYEKKKLKSAKRGYADNAQQRL
jgi:hypothetical protein